MRTARTSNRGGHTRAITHVGTTSGGACSRPFLLIQVPEASARLAQDRLHQLVRCRAIASPPTRDAAALGQVALPAHVNFESDFNGGSESHRCVVRILSERA